MAHLNERLDYAPALELLLTHTLGHLARVTLNTSYDGVRVGAFLRPIVLLLNDDNLLASLTAL